jgi:hypothetical protein
MHAQSNDILGEHVLVNYTVSTNPTPYYHPTSTGYADHIDFIHNFLRYDNFYGDNVLNDNTYGVYRDGQWLLDNGTGRWQGCNVDGDLCGGPFGAAGDQPITGNWVGSTNTLREIKLGTYRPSTQRWHWDNGDNLFNGCGSYPSVDKCAGPFGLATDQAVAGDWNGNGKAQGGVFRRSTGQWFLDNGNNVWEGCGVDLCACCFGMEGDRAAVGDWDGNGIDDIGVF